MNEKKAGGKKLWLSVAAMIVIVAVTFVWLLRDADFAVLYDTIRGAKWQYLLIGLGCMFLFVACEAVCSRMVMRSLGKRVSFGHCYQSAFVGFYFSSITPSATGGQPMQIYYMGRDRVPVSLASLNFLILTACYQIAMLVYGGGMFLYKHAFVVENVRGIGILLLYGIAVNAISVVVIFSFVFSQGLVRRVTGGILKVLCKLRIVKDERAARAKLESQLSQYKKGAEHVKRHPMIFVKVLGITFIQLTALYAVPAFVYWALGLNEYRFVDILAVQSLLTVAVSSLPLPGAVGASEGGFVTLFKLFFGAGLVLPAMMLSRGISFYLFLLVSGSVSVWVHIDHARKKRQRTRSLPVDR